MRDAHNSQKRAACDVANHGLGYQPTWFWPGLSRISWRHHKETITVLMALCAGNSQVTGEFHSQKASNADFDVGPYKLLNSQMTGNLRLHDVHGTSFQWWYMCYVTNISSRKKFNGVLIENKCAVQFWYDAKTDGLQWSMVSRFKLSLVRPCL